MKKDALHNIYIKAVKTRDPRFDGRFFTGVKTTGIYCRPVCPAQPKPENMEFFPSALAAEQSGYRPCMRCRPEVAPNSAIWLGSSAVVRRALRLVDEGRLLGTGEDAFADSFGMTSRHLRRLFKEEIGLTPKQLSDRQRLNFARTLLLDTSLPIVEVAFSSGFESVRRFNDAFQKRFKQAPSSLRKASDAASQESGVTLHLPYRPPFHWKALMGFHVRHEMFGSEANTPEKFERRFRDPHAGTWARVVVENCPEKSSLKVTFHGTATRSLFALTRKIREMFDLDSDPLHLLQSVGADAQGFLERHPGIRVPRGWDAFEMAVGTILGQLVSIAQAQRLAQQLIEACGTPLGHGQHAFPTPEQILASDLSSVKTTRIRRETIHRLAVAWATPGSPLPLGEDIVKIRECLTAIKGIGPWSLEYICLRAFGDCDAFPAKDLIIGRQLAAMPQVKPEMWRPWRAYLALTLWQMHSHDTAAKKETL